MVRMNENAIDREHECDYCQGNLTFEIVDTETFSYTKTSVFDDLGTPCLKTKVNLQGLDFTTYMPINYCPFCGRKLER